MVVMVSNLDIFPKGLFLELFSADLFGGKSLEADKHEFADVKGHLSNASSHLNASLASIDPLNIIFGRLDADTNIIMAFAVASRIENPEIRSQAFTLIENYLNTTGLSILNINAFK